MAKYMLSVHSGEDAVPAQAEMSGEDQRLAFEQIQQLEEQMRADGVFLFSGRLHEPDTATVLRTVDGETVMTDGPFVESKEHLAGFYLIQADDLDDALGWARRTAAIIQVPLEVRPLWDESGS